MSKSRKGSIWRARLAIQQFGIDAMQPHGIAAPGIGVALGVGVVEVEHAALGDHGVEVEILLQPLPELHRQFVERVVARQQVVGADDRRVAADIAGADIALFQHRDIGDAEFLGEVIGRRQSMPAAADDNHVIVALRNRAAPGRLPVLVAAKRIEKDGKGGVAHDRFTVKAGGDHDRIRNRLLQIRDLLMHD